MRPPLYVFRPVRIIISSHGAISFAILDPSHSKIITGTYNNFFRIFDRQSNNDYCYEASRDMSTLGRVLRNKRVTPTGRKRKDEVSVESLDFNRKILHAEWHPRDNILAIAATNNLYLFHEQQP